MKNLITLTTMILFAVLSLFLLSGCNQTKVDLVASKCRLKLPIKKEQCIAAGIHPARTFGGRMEGLPVSGIDISKMNLKE